MNVKHIMIQFPATDNLQRFDFFPPKNSKSGKMYRQEKTKNLKPPVEIDRVSIFICFCHFISEICHKISEIKKRVKIIERKYFIKILYKWISQIYWGLSFMHNWILQNMKQWLSQNIHGTYIFDLISYNVLIIAFSGHKSIAFFNSFKPASYCFLLWNAKAELALYRKIRRQK